METVDLVQNAFAMPSPAGRSCARRITTATAGISSITYHTGRAELMS
jgi:hypothetical protein